MVRVVAALSTDTKNSALYLAFVMSWSGLDDTCENPPIVVKIDLITSAKSVGVVPHVPCWFTLVDMGAGVWTVFNVMSRGTRNTKG